MKYQLEYSSDFVFDCGKRTTIIDVDLTDEEVEQIRSVVIPGEENKTCWAVEKNFPELYSKLFDAGMEFTWYVAYLDTRLSGIWEECTERNISEKKLMKEDIDYGGFDPHDKNGKLLKGQDRYNAWITWEEEHLEGLPFSKRSSYYANRYDITDLNLEEASCKIIFPPEIIEPALKQSNETKHETSNYPISFIIDDDEFEDNPRKASILVPLTDDEVKLIREIVPKGEEEQAYRIIQSKAYKLHHKIVHYADDFYYYVEILGKRLFDRYYEELDFIKEEDMQFLEDDKRNRGYDPHDENGNLLEGEALLQHWMNWEEHQLDGQPYASRQKFYFNRYFIENDLMSSPKNIHFYFSKDFFDQQD